MAELNTTSPLKRGLKELGGLYVQGAKDFGNRASNIASTIKESTTKGQGILQTIANQNTQGGKGGLAASANPSGIAKTKPVEQVSGAYLQKKALGEGITKTLPPNFTPISTSEASKAFTPEEANKGISNEYAKSDYGKNALFNENVRAFGSAESRPSTYTTSSGEIKQSLGGTVYTQDADGNILKRSPTGEISNVQNRVSTISTGFDPEVYKKDKLEGYYKSLMLNAGAGSSTGRTVNTAMLEAGRKGLEGLRAGDIELAKDASSKAIQERTLGLNARKEAAQEQRDIQRLGLGVAKAQSEAEWRRASSINDTLKLISEASKLGDEGEKVSIYKQSGMWNPLSIKSVYSKERLGDFKTPDELREILANDKAIDPADYEAIEFSYFGNQ